MELLRSAVLLGLLAQLGACALAPEPGVRVATFNVHLFRDESGALHRELESGSEQARAVAEIIQRVRPHVLLLNEFDWDPRGDALRVFKERYLGEGQNGAAPISYDYAFSAPVNNGVATGMDLDNDGATDGPGDAFGWGAFPGQYGMVVLSQLPIVRDLGLRTFRTLLWKNLPGALLPDDSSTDVPGDWFNADELAIMRLPSTGFWDVPIDFGDRIVHLLASHPTPPVFDGPEDRNGRRNHDEIRLIVDYFDPERGDYLRDDDGRRGGMDAGEFVVAGDLNADPHDGDSYPNAIEQLLAHGLIADPEPRSAGGVEHAVAQGGANDRHAGDPALDTADFGDDDPGNLRVDYVLPSRGLEVLRSGVFWLTRSDPDHERLIGDGSKIVSSDHRLVWIDLAL